MARCFEDFGNIIRDNNFVNLRDNTEWIFIPSMQDPGQLQVLPQDTLADMFVDAFRGANLNALQSKIKKVTLGTNPMRISFHGKQIVFCRYDFMTKLKQNHHPKINFAQEKSKVDMEDSEVMDEFRKVSNTILK